MRLRSSLENISSLKKETLSRLIKKNYLICKFCLLFSGLLWSATSGEDAKDTREGEDVTLECRFSPQQMKTSSTGSPAYWWARTNRQLHDNVIIGDVTLDSNYKWVKKHNDFERIIFKIKTSFLCYATLVFLKRNFIRVNPVIRTIV